MINRNRQIRTQTIDNLVNRIKSKYCCDTRIDYDKLCSDIYVTRIPSQKVFQGVLKYVNGGVHIFVPNQHKLLEEYSTAHELGHLLLGQEDASKKIEEKEAHYFARALTGMGIFEYYILSLVDVAIFMIKYPLLTKKFILSRNRTLKDYLSELSIQYEKAGHKINRCPQHIEGRIPLPF